MKKMIAADIDLSITSEMATSSGLNLKTLSDEKPVLLGVSFGGIMVQEMSKHLPKSKVIIIYFYNVIVLPSYSNSNLFSIKPEAGAI